MNKTLLWYCSAIVIVLILAGISINGCTPEIKEVLQNELPISGLLLEFIIFTVFIINKLCARSNSIE